MVRRMHGFTLLEVLVAMLIIAILLIPVMGGISGFSRSHSHLEDITVAGWVTNNLMTETRLQPQTPAVGNSNGKVEMSGRTWLWQRKISATEDPAVRRIDIEVRLNPESEQPLYSLIGYVGQH